MDHKMFKSIAERYNDLMEEEKSIKLQKKVLQKKMNKMLEKDNLDEFSFQGAKATTYTSQRKMYLKEKLIEKFGEENLEDCTKTINSTITKISYNHEK